MEKNTLGKEVNLNGEYIYNVEKILVECEAKYNDKNSFIEYLSKLLNEKQKDLLLRLYSIAEKQFILSILEKTLKVINEGGITKNNVNSQTDSKENVRTVSGTFLYLIKQSDVLSKKDIKRIFWRNNAKKKEKKKFNNKFDKLNIQLI